MRYIIAFILLFSLNANADMVAFLCTYGNGGEVTSAEEIKPGQTTLTDVYHWSDDLAVKVTIFDLTKQKSSGIVVEVSNGKMREFEADCFLNVN